MDIKAKKQKNPMPIRKIREDLKMTRPQVRAKAGVPERTLQHVEEGNPTSAETAYRLTLAYGISLKRTYEALGYDVSDIPD